MPANTRDQIMFPKDAFQFKVFDGGEEFSSWVKFIVVTVSFVLNERLAKWPPDQTWQLYHRKRLSALCAPRLLFHTENVSSLRADDRQLQRDCSGRVGLPRTLPRGMRIMGSMPVICAATE